MQETRVQSAIWEDPTCHRATKPMHCYYQACALGPRSCNYWAHMPQLLKSSQPRAQAPHCNKEWPLLSATGEKPPQQWRLSTAKSKYINIVFKKATLEETGKVHLYAGGEDRRDNADACGWGGQTQERNGGCAEGLGFDRTGQRQEGDRHPDWELYWPHLTSKLPQPHRRLQKTRRTHHSQHSRQPRVSSTPVPRTRSGVSVEWPQTSRTQIFPNGL